MSTIAPSGGKIIGTFRAHPRGFGFVIPESPADHEDLFIPPGRQLDAVTGDTVLARAKKKGKRAGKMVYEGTIIEILERGQNRFVGRLEKKDRQWFVWPDGRTLHVPILIPDAQSQQVKSGTQVVVEIIQYPSEEVDAQGVIVEVLGQPGNAFVDALSMIRQYHLPDELPTACVDEARNAAQSYDPDKVLAGREDLGSEVVITIDPDGARDFDDAISLKYENGQWELGVHIADVSHFVKTDSSLDAEARNRGNSVYFPGYVIPMLPEVLSNGVCSLQEGVPRLVKSAFVRYDQEGHVLSQRFSNSIICSSKRLTYGEATSILEGKTGGFSTEVVELLRRMEQLARIIQQRRIKEGMIMLDLPTVELVLDDDGQVTGVEPEDQSFSHTIIEMFMVEANEAVARLLTRLNVPHLRRIHPEPDQKAGRKIKEFLNILGYRLPKNLDRRQIQKLLERVKGKPESFSVNLAILRSMQPAEYSPQLLGHFALASSHYSHFTSPIRRYPDLSVHRLLDLYLAGELDTAGQRRNVPTKNELAELGSHCSFTEKRAEDAERELKQVKILQLLSNHIGEEFQGVVVDVNNSGMFVQLDDYLVDGFIRLENMSDDWWEADPEAGSIVGERTGRRITVGDVLKVAIVQIDIPARQLDLQLHQQLTTRGRAITKTRKKSKSKKQGTRGSSRRRKKKLSTRKGRRGTR